MVNLSDLSLAIVVALGVGAHLAVSLFLFLRYLDTGGRLNGLWALAYAMLTAHEVVEVMMTPSPAWFAARHVLVLAPALVLFGSFPGNRPFTAPSVGLAAAAVGVSWFLASAEPVWPWAALPVSPVAAVLFLVVSRSYRRMDSSRDDTATRLVGWAFILTGCLQFAYPFLRPTVWGSAVGGLLSGGFTLMLGVGLVLRTWQDTQELDLLSAITRTLNRSRDTRESIQEVLRLIGSLLGVETAWVFLRERDRFVLAGSLRVPQTLSADGAARMLGDCRCLTMLAAGELSLPVNIVDCQRLEQAGLVGRHASIPLRASQTTVGLLNLVLPGGRAFNDRQLQMLAAVGQQIGIAVERGFLFEEVAAKERTRGDLIEKLLTAHEDERRRIARELHDEAGQALTALIVNLELAAQETSHERMRAHLGQLRDLAERTLAEIRRLIYDLRPSILDDLGLAAALRWYAKNLLDPRGITWTLSVTGISGRLPGGLETVAFRLVQEALTNVTRHAEASSVAVSVSAAGRELSVRIEDNGRGFDPGRSRPADRHGGFGLLGMQERVELVGGRWEVQSTPGVGTVVSAILPIRDEGAGV